MRGMDTYVSSVDQKMFLKFQTKPTTQNDEVTQWWSKQIRNSNEKNGGGGGVLQ